MIDSLKHLFPACKIIYLVRNPLQVIPSYISMLKKQAEILDDPISKKAIRNFVVDMARYWYTYPLQMLDQMPKSDYQIIKLENLANNVKETIDELYKKFGLTLHSKYAQKLNQAAKKSRKHKSKHRYSLKQTGLTKEEIISEFQDIFNRFNFKTV
jgi:hypothetical protein